VEPDPTTWPSRWREALSDAPARRRVEALLAGRDASALVQALPAQDLYLLVREVGLDDCAELVALCSGEQLQAFLDLDAWEGDRADPAAVARWVRALVAGRCRDLPGLWRSLDPPLQVLVVQRLVLVQEIEPDEEAPETLGVFLMDTPDRRYRLSAASGADVDVARALLAAELAQEPIALSVLASEAAAAVAAECEELAFRFRSGRLADLGFPDLDDALLLETPFPSLEHARRAARGLAVVDVDTELPRWLVVRAGEGLLAAALELLDPAVRARVGQDLVCLCNAALVGWRTDVGEPEEVRTAATRVQGLVSLAMRALGAPDPETAATLLESTPARVLYRTAWTVLHGPVRRARALLPLAGRLPAGAEAFLEALAARPPRLPDGSPLSDPLQVRQVEARLQGLEWAAGWLEGQPEETMALDAFGTWLVRRALDLPQGVEPVPAAAFRELLRRSVSGGRLDSGLVAAAEAEAGEAATQARALCEALEEEWGGLDPDGPLEPRFLAGILLT